MRNKAGKLHLALNAINSYDLPIHIVYGADPVETDVENTMVDTVQQTSKIIRNGQLLIIHQNKLYNILGEQL